LIGLQIVSGFCQTAVSGSSAVRAVAELHKQPVLNGLLVFLFIFHSLYGVRTILMDIGFRREKTLFWVSTTVGTVAFAAFCVYYVAVIAG
jgi:succinate dehydrogenase/fumarate reductase cytochrome b subunit